MLTSYMVKCPHSGCGWSGSLLPCSNANAWHVAQPIIPKVTFQCPKCERQWQARVRGDDVEPLPLDEVMVVAT